MHLSSSSTRTGNQCPFSGVDGSSVLLSACSESTRSCLLLVPVSVSLGEWRKRRMWCLLVPPAARTRAQTRADRTKMNLNVISPRSTTVKATIASSGPRGISLRGVPVEEISSATARNKLRAGIYSPTLGSPVTSPTARTAAIYVACANRCYLRCMRG